MLIRLWGTRGSLPTSLTAVDVRAKLHRALLRSNGRDLSTPELVDRFITAELDFATAGHYGGSSSCVEIETGRDDYVLCDLGSGLRPFGLRAVSDPARRGPRTYHVFMSHPHWDHIMGFPFFLPAYTAGNVIKIHGCHPVEVLRGAFVRQQSQPCFPVNFGDIEATVEFVQLEAGQTYDIAGLSVRTIKQHHSGDSYGYRFERAGKVFVYSTDSEHKVESIDETYPFIEFFRDADLVVFDAMYTLADAISIKEDWGHSSNIVGVELCHLAGVKRLCLFHHEPVFDDQRLQRIVAETARYEEIARGDHGPLDTFAGYDGLEIQL